MDCCYLFVLLINGLMLSGCTAEHDKSEQHLSHVHRTKEHKKKILQHHKTKGDHYHSALHKKEEMLGQDSMRINEAEFKLQSLVSPEFHQGRNALNAGKTIGNMEVNTLTPEQIDFVQTTSQWPKFYNPQSRKQQPSRTIYPEDPVLFPHEQFNKDNSNNNGNWISIGGLKQGTVFPYDDMPMGQRPMSSLGNSMDGLFGRTPQNSNPMMFEEKPGYLANQNPPMDDKMSSSLSDFGGVQLDNKMPSFNTKNMFGSFGGSSKNSLSSLLDDGLMRGHGKPIGILGNILKASQSLPTGRVVKPSARSQSWFNDGPFSRRQKLERSKSIDKTGSQSNSEKHAINKLHKQIFDMSQKTAKKTLKNILERHKEKIN